MQVDPQKYLDLLEKSGDLVFWDTESQGREGDYGRMYVISIKPFNGPVETYSIGENFQDKGAVIAAAKRLSEADAWVTFYGKGHDVPLLNTRLLRYGKHPLVPKHHIDMYFQIKYKIKTGSKSQAHLLEFLEDTMVAMGLPPRKKMTVSPNIWSDLPGDYKRCISVLEKRCESDCEGLESLYKVCRHLIRDIKVG